MGSYIAHFIVYTLAMSGLICFALFIFKKFMNGGFVSKGTKYLTVEETLSINPRKSIMIIKAGGERFLVASDVDRTSLIAKLESKSTGSRKISKNSNVEKNVNNELRDIINIAKSEDIDSINIKDFVVADNEPTVNDMVAKVDNRVQKKGSKPHIHLDVITSKNPSVVDRGARKSQKKNLDSFDKFVEDVGEFNSGRVSPIHGIASKISKL